MQKSILLGGFGAVLILLAAILGFVVFPNVMENKIISELRLSRGSAVWNKWVDIESAVHLKFYVFNVTNPADVEEGKSPKLQQLGPYVYRQRRQKVDPRSETCKETVTYEQRITYFFDEEQSEGSEDDIVNIINVPYITLMTLAPMLAPLLPDETIVRKSVTVGDVTFQGFDVSHFNQTMISPGLDPEQFSGFRFGLYKGRNGSTDGLYEVYSGTQNVDYFGVVKSWNGASRLPFWNGTRCNDISGTDGSIFPPFVEKDRIVKIFKTDLCRTLELGFSEEIKVKNIDGYRFTPKKETLQGADTNPDNACFCRKQLPGECKDGVIDVSVCKKGAPIVLSKPHFLDGYSEYASYSGLVPDRSTHETVVDIEPKTGLLLAASSRIQINVELKKILGVPQFEKINTTVPFPALWVSEESSLCDVDAKDFKDRVEQPTKSVNIAKWVVLGIGIACILIAVILPIALPKKSSTV